MYIFYEDPGHGWLRVPIAEIEPIKDQISRYSYIKGKYIYLEEDCDMAIFMIHKWGSSEEAYKHIKSSHTDNRSRIRGYESYDTPVEIKL